MSRAHHEGWSGQGAFGEGSTLPNSDQTGAWKQLDALCLTEVDRPVRLASVCADGLGAPGRGFRTLPTLGHLPDLLGRIAEPKLVRLGGLPGPRLILDGVPLHELQFSHRCGRGKSSAIRDRRDSRPFRNFTRKAEIGFKTVGLRNHTVPKQD